ncbi:hypothetical protein JOQ06_019320 [Pogonophryne albipinna]|uniref:PiggyBac transposable element-derived protein domain-containing protein n=1 Tax=Pogonophryne albipinna TaxID=1090488 RepID=A0AAD6ASR3_9TELE|nr:hypothetical protein JOQ06_019320 [Pogonophryne albipinna]
MKASKSREVHSTEFGFNGSMTMISYIRKKGKAVLLLSTMHHSKMVDENSQKKKTEIILFYNQTKGGVDIVDQMVGYYTCKRQTQRWPMVLWCGVTKAANQQQERSTEGQQKRKRCQMCPRNKHRKATNCCWKCSTPVCNGHSQKQIVCDNCTQ